MQNFIIKLRNFMEGRNGPDKLTFVLLLVYSILSFVKTPFRKIIAVYIIVSVLQYGVLIFGLYRIFSKDIQKRYRENFKLEQLLSRYNPIIERTKLRVQYFGTHRFRTCKGCGEFLRFKKGSRKKKTVCPKCGKELTFHFLF